MSHLIPKVFSLSDMKYGWCLLLSMLLCVVSYYADRLINPEDQFWIAAGYTLSFAVAVVWGAINYIGHMRVNVKFQKHHDIEAYIQQLAMSQEDRLELQNYLEDYAKDLMGAGKSREDASREAISQFKVKELMSLSKNTTLFDLHAHYYLFGWTIFAIILFIVIGTAGYVWFPSSPHLLITLSILAAYGAGLSGTFFVYKVLDVLIYKKVKEYFT